MSPCHAVPSRSNPLSSVVVVAVCLLGCGGATRSAPASDPARPVQCAPAPASARPALSSSLPCPDGTVSHGAGTPLSWCARETPDSVVWHGPFRAVGLKADDGTLVTVTGQFRDDRRIGMWQRQVQGEVQWQGSYREDVRQGDWQSRVGGALVSWQEPEKPIKLAARSVREPDDGVSGGCVKADVGAKVRAEASLLRACYDVGLAMDPRLAGKVTTHWTINSHGLVDDVQFMAWDWTRPKDGSESSSSAVPELSVMRCLAVVLGSQRFDPPTHGVCVIEWPFYFAPG